MPMLCGHIDGNNQEVVADQARACRLLEAALGIVHASIPMIEKVRNPSKSFGQHQARVNKTLKVYVKCFNEELATIHNSQENGVLMEMISGVRPKTPFWDKL